jgi:hypothetical protein
MNDHVSGTPISVLYRGAGHWRDLRLWLIDKVHEDGYFIVGADPDDPRLRQVIFTCREDAIRFALTWS